MEYNLYTGSEKNHIINNYFNIYNNSPLTKLKEDELEFLLQNLTFPIRMRESLNFDERITFGTELEFMHESTLKKIQKMIRAEKTYETIRNWKLIEEKSVNGKFELISPILKDDMNSWEALSRACYILKSIDGFVNERVGSHVHIGSQIMNDGVKSIIKVLKFWAVYEHIIFRFSYGENSDYRGNMLQYANNIRENIVNNSSKIFKAESKLEILEAAKMTANKTYCLDFSKMNGNEYHQNNTVEVRCPNGTLENAIWQNNINFFVKLLAYVNSDKFDEDLINKKFEKLKNAFTIYDYYLLDIPTAVELSDMLFDNNLDKLNFMSQYWKDGSESTNFQRKIKLI
jgi:hypothetical protein